MPNRKIGSAALAGGLSIILVWAIKLTTVLSFVTGYVVPEPTV
jgi:hypothetical protein